MKGRASWLRVYAWKDAALVLAAVSSRMVVRSEATRGSVSNVSLVGLNRKNCCDWDTVRIGSAFHFERLNCSSKFRNYQKLQFD